MADTAYQEVPPRVRARRRPALQYITVPGVTAIEMSFFFFFLRPLIDMRPEQACCLYAPYATRPYDDVLERRPPP